MKFIATEEQVKQIAVNAINASSPVGMGYLQYESKDYTPNEINLFSSIGGKKVIEIDYFHGRMVKLSIGECSENVWNVGPDTFRLDYQSFAGKYPTPANLVKSVEGIEIIEE